MDNLEDLIPIEN